MKPFAKPEEVVPYKYPVFPDPEHKKLEFSVSAGVYTGNFVDFEKAPKVQKQKEEATIVQPVLYQDFKKILGS